MFADVTEEKRVEKGGGGLFAHSPSSIGLSN